MNELYENSRSENYVPDSGIWSREENLTTGDYLVEKLIDFTTIEINSGPYLKTDLQLTFNISLQPAFNKNFNLLADYLLKNQSEGYTNYILC